MWADHFEALGTPSENAHFDNGFLDTVVRGVQEIFISCTNDCTRALSQPLEYEEVAHICTNLKAGVSGVSTTNTFDLLDLLYGASVSVI